LIVSVRAQLAVPKGIAARWGYPNLPLWVTEFGLSTSGDGSISLADQAVKLVAIYETEEKWARLPPLYEVLLTSAQEDDHAATGCTRKGSVRPPGFTNASF